MSAERLTRITASTARAKSASKAKSHDNATQDIDAQIETQKLRVKKTRDFYNKKLLELRNKGQAAIKAKDAATLTAVKKRITAVRSEGMQKLAAEKTTLRDLLELKELTDVEEESKEKLAKPKPEPEPEPESQSSEHITHVKSQSSPKEQPKQTADKSSNNKMAIIVLAIFFWPITVVYGLYKLFKMPKTQETLGKLWAFIKGHKRASIGVAVGIVALIVISNIVNAINTNIEQGRDYYINVDDKISYDCNLKETQGGYLECANQKLSGSFSNSANARFRYDSIETNGDKFDYKEQYMLDRSIYETKDYDATKLASGIDHEKQFILYNEFLKKEVAVKSVNIHYNLSANDIQLLTKKHQEWAKEKAAAEKKAKEEEAKRKAEVAAQQKAEQEAEAKKKAAEEAEKKAAEQKAAEDARYPTETGTRELCDQAFHKVYPYKKSKIHSILGVIALQRTGSNKMLYKAKVTIQNAYGATYDAVMECVIRRDVGTDIIRVDSFNVY